MLQTDAKATVFVCSPTRALGGSGEAQLLTLSGAPLPSPLLGELFIPIGDDPNMSGSQDSLINHSLSQGSGGNCGQALGPRRSDVLFRPNRSVNRSAAERDGLFMQRPAHHKAPGCIRDSPKTRASSQHNLSWQVAKNITDSCEGEARFRARRPFRLYRPEVWTNCILMLWQHLLSRPDSDKKPFELDRNMRRQHF